MHARLFTCLVSYVQYIIIEFGQGETLESHTKSQEVTRSLGPFRCSDIGAREKACRSLLRSSQLES